MSSLHFVGLEGRAEEIIQAVMDTPEVKGVPALDFTLHLVTEEIVVNIVNYAYPAETVGEVSINVWADDKRITLEFIDRGTPFDPLEKEDPDVTLGISERAIGGLGIFLVKQMMETVEYRYEGGCNILTVSKLTINS